MLAIPLGCLPADSGLDFVHPDAASLDPGLSTESLDSAGSTPVRRFGLATRPRPIDVRASIRTLSVAPVPGVSRAASSTGRPRRVLSFRSQSPSPRPVRSVRPRTVQLESKRRAIRSGCRSPAVHLPFARGVASHGRRIAVPLHPAGARLHVDRTRPALAVDPPRATRRQRTLRRSRALAGPPRLGRRLPSSVGPRNRAHRGEAETGRTRRMASRSGGTFGDRRERSSPTFVVRVGPHCQRAKPGDAPDTRARALPRASASARARAAPALQMRVGPSSLPSPRPSSAASSSATRQRTTSR